MELEITMFKKRLFIQLDDGWHILNDVNDTNEILMDYHCVSVVRKNNVHIVYYKDGYLVADTISLSYDELKEASKRILETDEEGTKLWRTLNGWYERPVKYVEYKGDKTND